jgi:hypothetical protein
MGTSLFGSGQELRTSRRSKILHETGELVYGLVAETRPEDKDGLEINPMRRAHGLEWS